MIGVEALHLLRRFRNVYLIPFVPLVYARERAVQVRCREGDGRKVQGYILAKTGTYQQTEKKQFFRTHKQAKDRSARALGHGTQVRSGEQNATFSPEIPPLQTTTAGFLFVSRRKLGCDMDFRPKI